MSVAPATAATAFAEITAVLGRYFDALYEADPWQLAEVFHPHAAYATPVGGELLHHTLDDYLAVVAEREAPALRGEARADAIEAISLAGPETAVARVRCAFAGRAFVDLLTLVRVDGRWQILAKVFHYDELEG